SGRQATSVTCTRGSRTWTSRSTPSSHRRRREAADLREARSRPAHPRGGNLVSPTTLFPVGLPLPGSRGEAPLPQGPDSVTVAPDAGAATLAAPRPAIDRRRAKRKAIWRRRRLVLLFMSPWILGFGIFFGYPLVFSAYLSFTHYDLLSA